MSIDEREPHRATRSRRDEARDERREPAPRRSRRAARQPGSRRAPTATAPTSSEDGAVMGRDFVIPGVDPSEHDPYRCHTGAQARPRRRGRDRDHRPGQAVRPHPDPQRPQPRPARRPDLDGARPLGDRQERADQAHRRPALPGLRRRPRARRVDPEHDRRRALRGAQKVRPAVPGRRPVRLDEHLRQHRLPAAPAHRQRRGGDRRDRQPPAQGGRPRRGDLQDAERALRRDAQARRLRPGAGARTGDRDVRRARLRPRPGAHGAALRADPRGPRRERRLLPGDQPRPRHRAPDRRLHRRALEAARSSSRAPKRSCSTPSNQFVTQFLNADVTGPLSMD